MHKPVTVQDVRDDKHIGKGSCSIWDETCDDAELQVELDKLNAQLKSHRAVLAELRRINETVLSVWAEREGAW
jgi:hypothetical protein